MLNRTKLLASNLTKAMVRYHSHGGIPGENLPIGLGSRYRITAIFCVYTICGFGFPFMMLRHQLLKK